jgi:hypothetical protein
MRANGKENRMYSVHETNVNGCHVTVEKIDMQHRGEDQYAATVSYKSYNANGVHVASPAWQNIGNKDETKSFIVSEVARASDHNKPLLKAG